MKQRLQGRIYLTEVNNRLYAIRLETSAEDASTVFPDVLEPIVSGFNIEDRFYIEDYSEELGIVWYRPGSRMPGNPWKRRVNDYTQQVFFAENVSGNERVEVYTLSDAGNDDLMALAARLPELLDGAIIEGEPRVESIDTREVVEFDVSYTSGSGNWSGRYFATYDEGRNLGLIIGARATDRSGEFEAHYNNIKRFMTFTPAEEYYPYTAFSESLAYDKTAGFDVDVPAYWQTVAVIRNWQSKLDLAFTAHPAGAVWLIWIDDASPDPQETFARLFVENTAGREWFDVDERGFRPVTIDGRDAYEIHGVLDRNPARPGAFFIVYDEERSRSYLIGSLESVESTISYEPAYEVLRSSFTIQPLSSEEE